MSWTILPLLHSHWQLCQLYGCCAAEVPLLSLNSLSSARPPVAFSLSFLGVLINISSFLILFTVIFIDFPLFSPFILFFFVPNCLLYFAPNEHVLLAKLVLFVIMILWLLAISWIFPQELLILIPSIFFFSISFWAFYDLEVLGNSPFEASGI